MFDFNHGHPWALNMDGVHFDGCCHHLRIANLRGTCFDDMVALNANDGICSPEEAVLRMTSVPAARFGIRDRGVVRPGAYADLAVWREENFCENVTYMSPHAFASGVEMVLVNGVVSYRSGTFTHNRAGIFLER